ncbi:cation channel sperm-associated protein subunit beta [Nothoprocta perdicaria]|uniref:cation channel sperm-associated protein subunit beta n=1 Tax=Nothoprocta perdicaria TaxID=30464 RepID=UPI000E1B564E|nr:cation channel sperm-associated protein subunit beta [Nothoprocta perdicaria]
MINCYLYNIEGEDSLETRRKLLLRYNSAGLAPTVEIFNSTYSQIFYFKLIMQDEDLESTWSIDIPRVNITYNTDIAPIEEWFLKFRMHHGLNMFPTEGTLLDILREPILQWQLGERIPAEHLDAVLPHVINITLSASPCANDVAVIGLICNATAPGVYVGVTYAGFAFDNTTWFNMTRSLCQSNDDVCDGLSLLKIVLTNHHLVLLTTVGLYISEDLCYPTGKILTFYNVTFCGFEMHDYFSANLWYNTQCLANRETYEEDVISVTFNKEKSWSLLSTCFYSYSPFVFWSNCLPLRSFGKKKFSKRPIAFLMDYQQNTGVSIYKTQKRALVAVHKLTRRRLSKKVKFPMFQFPNSGFMPYGMFFHPETHFLYVYGNEVWLSSDGGNSFHLLFSLEKEHIVKTNTCVYTHTVAFVSDKGSIFFSKAGLETYARSVTSTKNVFSLYCDHLGDLHLINFNSSNMDRLSIRKIDVLTSAEELNKSFDNILAPQYITEQKIIFFEYKPTKKKKRRPKRSPVRFLHKGQVIQYRPVGAGLIVDEFPLGYSPYYLSAVIVNVLEKFPIESEESSPCIKHTLTVTNGSGDYNVTLRLSRPGNDGFRITDVEKTVVIPGSSSFLITAIVDNETAKAEPTMPEKVPFDVGIPSSQWFMHNFGTTNGKKWELKVDTCRYSVQQNTHTARNVIKYLDLDTTYNFTFRVIPQYSAYPMFQKRLISLFIGNPSLLEVTTKEYWDEIDGYILQFSVHNKFNQQGKSSIAVVIPEASCICQTSAFIITLKTGCLHGKSIHYISPVPVTPELWLQKAPKDDNGFPILKELPVNYRPPSVYGIGIPISDNFYNADPSKPRMRNYFTDSKVSGFYKKCANKSSRAECNCTLAEKMSSLEIFSDCTEKVLRMRYPVTKLPIHFKLKYSNSIKNLTFPYFVTIKEVNQRENWEVRGINETSGILKIRFHLTKKLKTTVYSPDSLILSLYGSELFHFKVSTVPGVSHCNLSDEFQIYVDEAPLAFPGSFLISALTALFIGSIIFVAFLVQLYQVNIWEEVKRKCGRFNKVSPSESSSTAAATSASVGEQS